jgi:carboxypeptidase Taq
VFEAKLQELKDRLMEIAALNSAGAVLNWDQSTYMPPGGGEMRGRALAVVGKLSHEKFSDSAVGKLLDDLQAYADSLPPDHDDAALIRVTRREYEKSIKVPASFVAEFSEHNSMLYMLWAQARPENDFASLRPHLEKTLDFSRRLANFFPGYQHIADPLIDFSDEGMKAETVRTVFAKLREELVPIVRAITEQPPVDDSCVKLHFPEDKQIAFGLDVIKDYGYDLTRGRQDKTHHPFATRFSVGDVRITTRVNENYLPDCLFSTLHESGHAMYEQGTNPAYDGTPLGAGTSAGVHESQSRTWENIVGRSRGFWEHYYSHLQSYFPDSLQNVPLDTFYRAVNKVEPSLIRTDADEVTYNLHVMIRFDFELQLLEGVLAVKDLPEAWHARYQSDIGVRAPDDRDGVLQDVHWYAATIGGVFQGYTLGNIMSAQFYDAALKAHPEIPSEIAQGQFGTLHGWLKENIYQHGSKYTASQLLERITGGGLQTEPLIKYLRTKYGELYKL